MKILMVCLGNICRSPLAEGIMKQKIQYHHLDWTVDSAGTGSWHVGELPDRRSIEVAQNHNIDIKDQRARKFQPSDLDTFDLIFAMDSSNYQNIMRHVISKDQEEKVQMIMNMVKPNFNQNIPDPYWDDNGFENVFQMLDSACEKVVEKYHS